MEISDIKKEATNSDTPLRLAPLEYQITEFKSIKSKYGQVYNVSWEDFVRTLDNMSHKNILNVTHDEFMNLDPDRQVAMKDGVGFVGGVFTDNRRHKSNLISRSMMTLDIDDMPELNSDQLIEMLVTNLDAMGLNYIIHNSFKHTFESPRFRVIIPLAKPTEYLEFYAATEKMYEDLCIKADKSCRQADRIMYYPKSMSDCEPVFISKCDGSPLYIELSKKELNRARHNTATKKKKDEYPDPETFRGIEGTINKFIDIPTIITTYLSDLFLETSDYKRYTIAGHSWGGVILFESPSSGRLCGGYCHNQSVEELEPGFFTSFDLLYKVVFNGDENRMQHWIDDNSYELFKIMIGDE